MNISNVVVKETVDGFHFTVLIDNQQYNGRFNADCEGSIDVFYIFDVDGNDLSSFEGLNEDQQIERNDWLYEVMNVVCVM